MFDGVSVVDACKRLEAAGAVLLAKRINTAPAILLLLAVLIVAGPLLEELLDWLMPPRDRRPGGHRHSGVLR